MEQKAIDVTLTIHLCGNLDRFKGLETTNDSWNYIQLQVWIVRKPNSCPCSLVRAVGQFPYQLQEHPRLSS